jgi:hypothetical protein
MRFTSPIDLAVFVSAHAAAAAFTVALMRQTQVGTHGGESRDPQSPQPYAHRDCRNRANRISITTPLNAADMIRLSVEESP